MALAGDNLLTGGCLCGAVKFRVARASLRNPVACHCSQCRRWGGGAWPSANAPTDSLNIEGDGDLHWYRSSGEARRGFCGICGASLFWQSDARPDRIAVSLGAFDAPAGGEGLGLAVKAHIFVASKGDYYDIADGLPQLDEE